jgi:HAD superfamily hydrolase (TIGR01450 family)
MTKPMCRLQNAVQPARKFLFDLDGTLVIGCRPLPGAVETIRHLEDRFVVVSNNSTHTPDGLSADLACIGLDIPPERIVLAGDLALRWASENFPEARLYLCASPAIQKAADRLGFTLAEDGQPVDIVLLLRDEAFSYQKLCSAVNAVRQGALLVASNPDISHPGLNGAIVPETGALLKSFLGFPDVRLHRMIGKPEPDLFLEGARRLGASPHECVMVGDNSWTDGVGSAALGMTFVHINHSDGIGIPTLDDLDPSGKL